MSPEWERMLERYNALEAMQAEVRIGLDELGRNQISIEEFNQIRERRRVAQAEFDSCWEVAERRLRVKEA